MVILEEVTEPLPRCDQCVMHIPSDRLFKHRGMDKCNKGEKRIIRQRDVEMVAMCVYMELSMYREEGDNIVEVAATFNYLGQTLDQTGSDVPVVRQNIMRARSVWGMLGKLL